MSPRSEPSTPEEPSNIVALPGASEGTAPSRFSAPENFINRELSWLEFNRRVLEEAQDPTQPLIERVKRLESEVAELRADADDGKVTRLRAVR